MQITKKNTLLVVNPATGETFEEIEETGPDQTEQYYHKSRKAQASWGKMSIEERMVFFRKLRLYMVENMREIAEVISKDTGKVLTEAITADVMPTIDAIVHIEKRARKVLSPQKVSTPLLLIGKKSYVEYMPRGVVLVISPWNYPLNLAMVPVLSALAGGNAVILKPSEITPLVGKLIGELFNKVEFPQDIVQIAQGGKKVGEAFTQGDPDYIFFTGSVSTGKKIAEAAAKKLIPTTLELGGKDPMIVFSDAHLKRAAKGAVWGAFTNSGQVCMSTERLYVEEAVYSQFLSLVKEEANSIKRGIEKDADLGSMTYIGQKKIIQHQLNDALEQGARLAVGTPPEKWVNGMFIPLMILTDVTEEMDIMKEETFGPVLPIVKFTTEEEVVEKANSTQYGLNASVWTADLKKARRISRRLISGSVVINDVITSVANHHLPFGGTKNSGIGRYHGDAGLRVFCHEKSILMDKGRKRTEVQWFPYQGKYERFVSLFQNYFGKKRNWMKFAKDYLSLLKK
ncbi:aldehyde dehydrogenase family protein [Falsibacillus albus]|uniref:Aldehyde dehydrogenase n=1 Tax=Falsibacillus albus TaxID=2478915 RepID=A0A3L7K4X3_9BACI|nr:aldehyde dehydrogenase family protein [Falsibacillus albus]RLQ97121.1 aldehyde dehydrogenase family protein [Falsibacillus albus]